MKMGRNGNCWFTQPTCWTMDERGCTWVMGDRVHLYDGCSSASRRFAEGTVGSDGKVYTATGTPEPLVKYMKSLREV